MKNLIFAVLVLSLGFISCKKETITPNDPNQNVNNNVNNGTTVDNYIWITLGSSIEYNNINSITYDDGTGNIVTLDGPISQSLFTPYGNGYYANIPVNGPVGYFLNVCIEINIPSPQPPAFYLLDVQVMAYKQTGQTGANHLNSNIYCPTDSIAMSIKE